MHAIITLVPGETVTLESTDKLSGLMLASRQAIQDVLNEAGNIATSEAA